MKMHPAADLFPMMTAAELDALEADIRENGQQEPVVLYHGDLLDGRCRLQICERLGREPLRTDYDGDSPVAFAISKNLHRRHLTPAQRAAVAVELMPLLAEEGKARMAAGGRRAQAAKSGHEMEKSPANEMVARGRATRKSAAAAGQAVGIGETSVVKAKRLKKADPEVFEQMKEGKISTVNGAMRKAGLNPNRTGKDKGEPEPEPAVPFELRTNRDRTWAEARKGKLVYGLSHIGGICHGLNELDMDYVLAVLSEEDRRYWAKEIRETINVLSKIKKRLDGGGNA